MAGIGRPWSLGQLVKNIKERHPEIIIQYHGHSGPGLSMASMLEVAENGADVLDVAIEPLSWGKVHPDVISVRAMLKDGFSIHDGHPTFNKTYTDPVNAREFAAELIKPNYQNGYVLPDMPKD
jgi:pyruvate/oxaloacetate carboxyltransferase